MPHAAVSTRSCGQQTDGIGVTTEPLGPRRLPTPEEYAKLYAERPPEDTRVPTPEEYAKLYATTLRAPSAGYAHMFTKLCNWFWYYTNPGWPPDGWDHTSDECRRLAREVFDLLELVDPAPGAPDTLSHLLAIAEYRARFGAPAATDFLAAFLADRLQDPG